MRVRTFELRLLAGTLTCLWAAAAGLVLLGYRPGGPLDLVVGISATVPVVIAAIGLVWPPVARGRYAFTTVAWMGIAATLLLIPSLGQIIGQISARGPQTLLPSPETIYPWVLALLATSLFAALGVARRLLGENALRRRRLVVGVLLAIAMTIPAVVLFASAAVANEIALRAGPVVHSRFGPPDPDLLPPECDGRLMVGPTARLAVEVTGEADLRSIGGFTLQGTRSGSDVRWVAEVATDQSLGIGGAARIGSRGWLREPRRAWTTVPPAAIDDQLLDASILSVALNPDNRAVAEDRGLEFVEGARARHCRIATTGSMFQEAVPQVRWIVGAGSLKRWRGQLDYWVFGDGQLGQVVGQVNGEAGDAAPGRLQATIRLFMTATDRGTTFELAAPLP